MPIVSRSTVAGETGDVVAPVTIAIDQEGQALALGLDLGLQLGGRGGVGGWNRGVQLGYRSGALSTQRPFPELVGHEDSGG